MSREWLLPTGPRRVKSEIYICDRCGHRHYYVRPPQICPQPLCWGLMAREEEQ